MTAPTTLHDPLALAEAMAEKIAPLAEQYDRTGDFAEESLRRLQHSGYAAMTVPTEYGGPGVGLYDLVRAQERLAQGDAAVALSIGMSLLLFVQEGVQPAWPRSLAERVMAAVLERGALVNSVASEPNLGSPSRGGKPETVAVPDGAGWRITGHKTFASLAPMLDFILVTATIQDGSNDVGRFMVERGEGVHVIETWDAMGMRATGSHDIRFEEVWAAPDSLVSRQGGGGEARGEAKRGGVPAPNPYFSLPVAAVYLGIAQEAQQAAIHYAATRVPPALGRPLTEVESIRATFADNERELRMARLLLHDCARRVEASHGKLDDPLKLDIYVAKHTATNHAISVVDRAMRVVGGSALVRGNVLERAYRNVRAGLHHPPADDITARVLAAHVVGF